MSQTPVPPRPPAPEKRRGSWLALLLIGMLAIISILVLCFLTLGHFLPVLIIGGLIFFITGMHYFVWGWWMTRLLRAESEEE